MKCIYLYYHCAFSKQRDSLKYLLHCTWSELPKDLKQSPEQNCVLCLCVCFAVEVLRCHRVHRLARGLQREGGSGSLLPGALPELWAELHQYVLEPGECAMARDVEASYSVPYGAIVHQTDLQRQNPLMQNQSKADCTKGQRTFSALAVSLIQHQTLTLIICFFLIVPDCRWMSYTSSFDTISEIQMMSVTGSKNLCTSHWHHYCISNPTQLTTSKDTESS